MMDQVPWKYVFLIGAIAVIIMNLFHAFMNRRDHVLCFENSALKASGLVKFSGTKNALSGGRYGRIIINTKHGDIDLNLGLDPVILESIKAGDSIRLEGNGRVTLPTGENYVLFRCN